MNAKNSYYACLSAWAITLACLCTGCATTGLQRKDTELVSANSRNIGRVESTAEIIGDTISDSRERLEIVRRASERIGEAGERLDYLFSEYEREVERILDELYTLKEQQEQMESGSNKRMGGSDSFDSGIRGEEAEVFREVPVTCQTTAMP